MWWRRWRRWPAAPSQMMTRWPSGSKSEFAPLYRRGRASAAFCARRWPPRRLESRPRSPWSYFPLRRQGRTLRRMAFFRLRRPPCWQGSAPTARGSRNAAARRSPRRPLARPCFGCSHSRRPRPRLPRPQRLTGPRYGCVPRRSPSSLRPVRQAAPGISLLERRRYWRFTDAGQIPNSSMRPIRRSPPCASVSRIRAFRALQAQMPRHGSPRLSRGRMRLSGRIRLRAESCAA